MASPEGSETITGFDGGTKTDKYNAVVIAKTALSISNALLLHREFVLYDRAGQSARGVERLPDLREYEKQEQVVQHLA